MSTVTPPSDHILPSSSPLEAAELLQKLSLDSPKKSLPRPESNTGKTSTVPYVPVERSVSPFVDPSVFYNPNTPFSPDFMDPSVFYNPSGYPSHTYYYGGNEWDRFVSPDGAEITPGVYGDYQNNYSYMPYGTYSPSGATVGHDGNLYGAQHYQYPTSYFQPPNTTSGPYTPYQPPTSQAEVSTSVGSNQLQLSVDTAKGNQGSVENVMTNRTNISKTLSSNYQNRSMKSNDFYGSGGLLPVSSGISSAVPHGNYKTSGKSQNLRPFPNAMGFQHTRATGVEQGGFVNKMYANNRMYAHYENTYGSGPGYLSSSYYPSINGRGWLTIDNKYKSTSHSNGVFGYNKGSMEGLNELNKGPRTKGIKYQNDSERITLAAKGQSLSLRENNNEDNLPIFPDRDQCNKDDFPETYSDAKFFVIKSYSEDDVHKSMKYGVWTSTASGNKKLDVAYKEAQEKSGGCPVFLLFSVNASGQFVGLAEMLGPVDFDKTVEYWQQDKWNGCFSVKWHIIKDVPNSLLRHIKLENNENKPVTNSRDTQEVSFEQGMQILKIFKSHSSNTCILDDFEFYEGREKVMLEKKARQRQFNKQGAVSAEDAGKQKTMGVQPSERSNDISSDFTEDTIAGVSADSEMAKVNGEQKLLDENSSGARGGDTSNNVQPQVEENK